MTPEQRLDRAERILIATIKSGRRTRSEWRYKINSLIDSQIKHEAELRIRWAKADEELSEHRKAMAELRESQKLTDNALRTFIESLSKNRNGNSD